MQARRTLLPLAPIALVAIVACGDDDDGNARDTADASAEVADTRPADTRAETGGPDATRSCDPIAQSGCEPGENCTYIAAETTPTCAPEGPVPANMECSAESRCERGVCLSINQTKSLCYQLCAEDTDCGAGTANECLTLEGAPYEVCKIPGIYAQCNLITQDCADETRACYAVLNEDEPICLAAGTGALGSECNIPSACLEGLACVNGVCRAICDPDVADTCGETATCRDYFDDAGYCAPN